MSDSIASGQGAEIVDGVLQCPDCRGDNIHLWSITVGVASVGSSWGVEDLGDVALDAFCENCRRLPRVLRIAQGKGRTFIEWVRR